MEAFIIMLLQCTLSMSVITLLYATVLPILSKRYAPKWRYMVWLVISAGWLIPFRPLIELPFLPAQSTNKPLMPVQFIPASPTANNTAKVLTGIPETVTNAPQFFLWSIVVFIWLAGVIFMLAYHVLRHRRFMKIVDRWSETVTSPELLDLLDSLKQEQGIKTKIGYKTCSSVSSPMMVGFFHPVILMPPVQLSGNELALILRHELTHLKRRDLWYKVMILAATILHWFNPVAYFMARATSLQCEISCDALVLQNEDMQTRKQYGETVIAVIRNGRTYQTALSTNFYGGKRGMKNRITSILDSKRKKACVAVLFIVLVGIMLTGATLVSAENQSTSIPNTSFSEEEYEKLLSLRFDGYEDMSVSEFQQKIWTAIDTTEYMQLLNRFLLDDQLEEMKDTNEIANFMFNVVAPLTGEQWQAQGVDDSAMSSYENADNAQFEYSCTLSILDADHLTVGEYGQARKGVMNELMPFFQERTKEELQDEQGMRKMFNSKIESLKKQWSSQALQIDIEYFFIPLEVYENSDDTGKNNDNYNEERDTPNATEDDYNSLLELKTADYQNRTVADFNSNLLDWANEDYDRMERINVDIGWDDFSVSLSTEELTFVTLTVRNSGAENGELVESHYTGKPKNDPTFSLSLPEKTLKQESQINAWCSLYYQYSYHIFDETGLTVGERDRCVSGVVSDIQKYWDTTSIDQFLTMSEQDVLAKLKDVAAQYSNDLITISIIPDQVNFDVMNEQSNNE